MQQHSFFLYLTLGNPISLYPCIAGPSILIDNLYLLYTFTHYHHDKYQSEEPQRCCCSPTLRYHQYDRGGPKDPPVSLVGTSRHTEAKRKSPPERKGAQLVIQQTNVDPLVILATLDSKEVVVLLPPTVPTVGQESTADTPANIEDKTTQLPF